MAIADLAERYRAERDERWEESEWFQTSLRLPGYLFDRLDALAAEVHESRQMLVARLLEEATFELAAELSRDESRKLDSERLGTLLGDLSQGEKQRVDRAEAAR